MISCSQYDYLEIACMYHFSIRLTLLNGETIEGEAADTGYNNQKQECLIINTSDGKHAIPTEVLKSLEVITDNPHFSFVEFKQ
ncbi:Rho-binding antiterminator [Vibrio taketomensis]|uniref:Rho-binding antiterminator n=1 Tax=Vibrio taketomensis TaxID=2572923 RepID=UPI00138A31F1|nr:Rho-binding antiterminator [Vibrio taketomensis]